MLGAFVGTFATAWVGSRLLVRVGNTVQRTPRFKAHAPAASMWRFGNEQTRLAVLMLVLIALAFALQRLLIAWIPGMREVYLPVVVAQLFAGRVDAAGF